MDIVEILAELDALAAEMQRDLGPLRRIAESVAARGDSFREVSVGWCPVYADEEDCPREEDEPRLYLDRDALIRFRKDDDVSFVISLEKSGLMRVEVHSTRNVDRQAPEPQPEYWSDTFREHAAICKLFACIDEYAAS